MNIRKTIADTGAILEGEFFFGLNSGKVSCKYVDLDPALTHPKLVEEIGWELIKNLGEEHDDWPETIAVPATGAIPLAYGAASYLAGSRVVWADKRPDKTFAFERMGFVPEVKGKRIVVLEDIASTGGSAKAVCDLVKQHGGTIVGVSCVWNRGKVSASDLGVPKLFSLIEEPVETWEAGAHSMWGTWPLVEDIGHPEHFLEYPGPRIKLLK